MTGKCIIIMGVSGSGKTTVGKALAKKMKATFIDGDDMHPQANIDKMHSGQPLNDDDRKEWLENINRKAREITTSGQDCIFACSALKLYYRQRLREGLEKIVFVYLKGSYNFILERIQSRKNHFFPVSLLQSQFDALEEPTIEEQDALTISLKVNSDKVVKEVIDALAVFFNERY